MRIIICVMAFSLFTASQAYAQADRPADAPPAATEPGTKAAKHIKANPEASHESLENQVQEANGGAPLSDSQKSEAKSKLNQALQEANKNPNPKWGPSKTINPRKITPHPQSH